MEALDLVHSVASFPQGQRGARLATRDQGYFETHRQFICSVCHSAYGTHGARLVTHTNASRPSIAITASQRATRARIIPHGKAPNA